MSEQAPAQQATQTVHHHHGGLLSGEPRFKGSWVKEHSLSLALLVVLVVQSVIFHFAEMPDWVSDQAAHGEPTGLWPGYWLHYAAEWFVSVLADTYGALLLVLFSKWFFERGSAESENQPDPGQPSQPQPGHA